MAINIKLGTASSKQTEKGQRYCGQKKKKKKQKNKLEFQSQHVGARDKTQSNKQSEWYQQFQKYQRELEFEKINKAPTNIKYLLYT